MNNPESHETPAVVLRRATIDDAEKILDIQKKVSSAYAFRFVESTQAAEDIREDISNINVYLIEKENVIAGSAAYQKEKDKAYISSFAIDPKFQGQGVGSQAMELILNELQDCKRIEVHTGENNQPMRTLLDRFGFTKESEYKIDNGETIFRLALTHE